jgi:hypothetical protein
MLLRCERHLLSATVKPSSKHKDDMSMDSMSSDTDISQDSAKVTTRHKVGEIFGR